MGHFHARVNPLIRTIPPALVRFFARPYVAGDSLQKAVDASADLLAEREVLTTLDLLAEDIDSAEAAQRNVTTYINMVDAVSADARFTDEAKRPTLSLKPSSYTPSPMHEGGDGAGSREAVFRICEYARHKGVRITVDMESSYWTDFTLELVRDLHNAGHDHVGAVLQTRLNRTEADLDRLPAGCRIRLVIGIYSEPKDIALTDKDAMKDRLITFGEELLRRGHYVEMGTHDERYIHRFVDETVPAVGVATDRYELQMLYGVPAESLQQEMIARGILLRLYMPFALGWPEAIAYLRRRLDEYPTMMWLVAKNWFKR